MKDQRPSLVRRDIFRIMEKGELQLDLCGKVESILNQESEGCNLDPFLKRTAGKLLIRRSWLPEERPRNMTPKPKCLPTKSCSRKCRQLTFGTEKTFHCSGCILN